MGRYRRVARAGEAIFWNGSNSDEIIEWVETHHGDQARYNPRKDERGYRKSIEDEVWPAFPGAISILTPNQLIVVRRNEYVFRDDNGVYSVMSMAEFSHEYEGA